MLQVWTADKPHPQEEVSGLYTAFFLKVWKTVFCWGILLWWNL